MSVRLLLWLAAIGQTIFVILWASMPWWREWVGRALMTKSAALCAVLWFMVAGFYLGDYPFRDELRLALILAVTCGIWLQVFAIMGEVRKAVKAGRPR